MHLAPEFYPNEPSNSRRWWKFCERADVKELNKQLHEGLIHPVEYAASVMRLAKECGLTLEAANA